MSISKDYNDYKDEIELALVQNAGVEIELYSIIACIVRESAVGSKISLRDVSSRRTSEYSARLKGDSGFPDFVLLSRQKVKDASILGCIEAKMPTIGINEPSEQLDGHVNYFSNVLYTNGISWYFYKKDHNDKKKLIWDCLLGKFENNKIVWEDEKEWIRLLSNIDQIEWSN